MTCPHVGSGCNSPEGECLGFCLNKGYEVQYKTGTKLTDRESGAVFVVSGSNSEETQYQGTIGRGTVKTSEVAALFEVDGEPMPTVAEALSALDIQEDGDHYKKLGAYQPWEVLRRWLDGELEFTTDELVQHCAGFLGSLGSYVLLQNAVESATTKAKPQS